MPIDQIPIGRFSLITRLTLKALRLYDKKGLLVPGAKDRITGYRYYSFDQIDVGIKLKKLAGLGFGLEDIQTLLQAEARGDQETVLVLFGRRREDIREKISQLEKAEELLLTHGSMLEVMNMSVEEPLIKNVPELRVLSKSGCGRYDELVPKLFQELLEVLQNPDNQKSHVKITGPGMSLCHDEVYEEQSANIEIALPVSGRVTLSDDEAQLRVLPKQEVVSLMHKGSYHKLQESYTRIMKFMEEQGLSYVPPDREVYLNSPHEVAEEELLTEIQLPFRKKEEK